MPHFDPVVPVVILVVLWRGAEWLYIVYRQVFSGPVVPSFRALSGRLKFTVRRHKFNKDSLSGAGQREAPGRISQTFEKEFRAGLPVGELQVCAAVPRRARI